MPNSKPSRKKPCSDPPVNRKKGVRSQRGVPETNYGEIKTIKSFSLTPTALILLKELSRDLGISASELLERFARSGADLKASLKHEVKSDNPFTEKA